MTADAAEIDLEELSPYAACRSILNAYSLAFFIASPRLGALLLAATFSCPISGLFGLAGVLTAFAAARILAFPTDRIGSGELLVNSLMAALGLAYVAHQENLSPWLMVVVLPVTSIAALLLTVSLSRAIYQLLGLSASSLPFVLVTIANYLLVYSFKATPVLGQAPSSLLPEVHWPPVLASWFLSFATALFVPNLWVGMAAFAGVLLHSRLLTALGAFGFAIGASFLELSGLNATAFGAGWMGTNYLYCGLALGGVYFIPSRSSLLLAGFGAILSTLIAIAIRTLLRGWNIPPLSLPFICVLWLFVYSMRQRTGPGGLFECPYLDGAPERNGLRFRTSLQRFPDAALPLVSLPFTGCWVITQGFNGKITHQSIWRHALDFEVLDASGNIHPEQRNRLEDAYTFGSAVLAPCDGTVVRVVNHIPDNPLGEQNLAQNWGNLVLLRSEAGWYALLCHFKQDGVVVQENQRVVRGQKIGYCGNSGRSPVPHLHLHVQATPVIGGATIPFRIRSCLTRSPEGKTVYSVIGSPPENAAVVAFRPDPELLACFVGPISTSVRYRLERDGKPAGWETIQILSTAWDRLEYRSLESGAVLRATISEECHVVQELEGFGSTLLKLLAVALSAVPFSEDRRILWDDASPTRPWASPVVGAVWDLTEPFLGVHFARIRSCFAPSVKKSEIAIRADVADGGARLPATIEVVLSPGLGIVECSAVRSDSRWRFVQERWAGLAAPGGIDVS